MYKDQYNIDTNKFRNVERILCVNLQRNYDQYILKNGMAVSETEIW